MQAVDLGTAKENEKPHADIAACSLQMRVMSLFEVKVGLPSARVW